MRFELEDSSNLIYSEGAVVAGRVVITKMRLHVPKLKFNSAGAQLYLKSYLLPHVWNYYSEQIVIQDAQQTRQGSFLINSSVSKPRHVFLWAINDSKQKNQHNNIFFHDTFSIANGKNLTSIQLEMGAGHFFPPQSIIPSTERSLIYRMLMDYNKSYNDYLTGSQLDRDLFENLYGIIYFDLRNQPEIMRNSVTKLTFKWQLDGNPNAPFSWFALVISEEEIRIVSESGKVFILNESNLI